MQKYREMRQALLRKLGISRQALSARVQKKIKAVPMSTKDATRVIAHEEGIRIDKYMDPDTLQRIRALAAYAPAPNPPKTVLPKQKKAPYAEIAIRFPGKIRIKNKAELTPAKLKEAIEMAAVYPLIYVLENSMREVIRRAMESKHGPDWWDTQLTRGKVKNVKDKADDRMKTESRSKWHQRRGSQPIDYTDMSDLETIARTDENLFFPQILGEKEWFGQFMRELYPSRNVLCHMNPLDKTNIADIKVKMERWFNLL